MTIRVAEGDALNMHDADDPIVVGFPLRGEWAVPNTPGTRVPSHGTDALGSRFAYDFLQVDWQRAGWPCYRASFLRYLLLGVPIDSCYCYGETVYAPCDGTVVGVEADWPERTHARLLSDARRAARNSNFDPEVGDVRELAGNHVILRCREGVYAALCHLRPSTVKVELGQVVAQGEPLGGVGHSGNSYYPHLHFQLMDDPDLTRAAGLPCAFASYEVFERGAWKKVREGVPTAVDRIRFLA